jgi:hypothetical protein
MRGKLRWSLLLAMGWLVVSELAHGDGKFGTYNSADASCGGAPESKCGDGPGVSLHASCNPRWSGPMQWWVASGGAATVRPAIRVAADSRRSSYAVSLNPAPEWVVSAAWDRTEERVLMADSSRGTLLQYDLHGEQRRSFGTDPPIAGPAYVFRRPDGYVAKSKENRFTHLDPSFKVRSETQYPSINEVSIYDWTPLGSSFLFFGDVRNPTGQWETGVFRAGLDEVSNCMTYPISFKSLARPAFRLGYPMFARLGAMGYALVMDEPPFILEIGADTRRLLAYPQGFRNRPHIPATFTEQDEPAAHAAFTTIATAAGLIAWEDALYVLTRRPGKKGTDWFLFKLDPRADHVDKVGIPLPTHADHLVVVPGQKHWALIEKGPVLAGHAQEIRSMVLVETAVMIRQAAPGSPAGAGAGSMKRSSYELVRGTGPGDGKESWRRTSGRLSGG